MMSKRLGQPRVSSAASGDTPDQLGFHFTPELHDDIDRRFTSTRDLCKLTIHPRRTYRPPTAAFERKISPPVCTRSTVFAGHTVDDDVDAPVRAHDASKECLHVRFIRVIDTKRDRRAGGGLDYRGGFVEGSRRR
jgi:hypothetical protein